MMQKTTKSQLLLVFAFIGPVLQGCRSKGALFPNAGKHATRVIDPLVPAAHERSSIEEGHSHEDWGLRPHIDTDDRNSTSAVPPPRSESPLKTAVNPPQLLASSLVHATDDAALLDTAGGSPERSSNPTTHAVRPVEPTISTRSLPPATDTQAAIPSTQPPTPGGIDGTKAIQALPVATLNNSHSADKHDSRLVISGVRPGRGDVKVAIFTNAKAFPQPSGASQVFTMKSDQSLLELPIQMKPPFAVAVYQDINGDGELSRNRLGIPVEPFAFSNNATGERGPPAFDDAKVDVRQSTAATLMIPINLP